MSDITIPAAAREAAQRAYEATESGPTYDMRWNAACRAMLENWPGMQQRIHIEQAIILPLPTEASDE